MISTIKDLRYGSCLMTSDGTVAEVKAVKEVLNYAFPYDNVRDNFAIEAYKYFSGEYNSDGFFWEFDNMEKEGIEVQSVWIFLAEVRREKKKIKKLEKKIKKLEKKLIKLKSENH